MPLRHVVTWKVAADSEEERERLKAEFRDRLLSLPSQIDVIRSFEVGLNNAGAADNFDVVLVSEAEIAAAIRTAHAEAGEVIEGAAAVGMAALAAGKVRTSGPVVVVLSGRNIDMALHARIVAGETPDLLREVAHA